MSALTAQKAIEALRNGVPNSDAVRALGCMQPEALDRYRRQLDRLTLGAIESEPPFVPGTLIAADFGAGKSHTLSYLEQEALSRNFVVSRVVISKETPLHNPAKLFQAAVREARLPDSRGSLLHELAMRVDYQSERAQAFIEWSKRKQPYGMLAASVLIDEKSSNAELKAQVVNWWSGEKLTVSSIRTGLAELGMPRAFDVKAVSESDLAPIRFGFAVRLARAAGFHGWVLLLDEVELVGRYSLLQRARSYAELARWLGAVPDKGVPGITTVAAITDDFDIEVLERREDKTKAPERLRQAGDQKGLSQAQMAETGIGLITSPQVVRLHAPSDDTLAVSFERLRKLYETAYGYAPKGLVPHEGAAHQAMRSYVRRWISDWDLDRLYGEREHVPVEETLKVDYSESPELSEEAEVPAGEVG
ncbi:MAG: BREX system ATP-binding domain-containing protein [Pirellulaceae bacterium]